MRAPFQKGIELEQARTTVAFTDGTNDAIIDATRPELDSFVEIADLRNGNSLQTNLN